MGTNDSPVLDWSVAAQPLFGEDESGDDAVVTLVPQGALVAAVDGLGHGNEAARAAAQAIELVRTHADEPLESLVERCHAALRATRGAAMSAARFCVRDDTMSWVGVGNIEGRLVRAREASSSSETLIPSRGAAGVQLQGVRATTLGIQPGDALVFATDGVDAGFADSLSTVRSAEDAARDILERHAKPTDDALVIVARYLGKRS